MTDSAATPDAVAARRLLSAGAVRERASQLLDHGLAGRLAHFTVDLDRLPACADVAERAGLKLGIETIPCSVGSPLANVARAVEREPRCVAVLDTEFLALHGEFGAAPDAGLPVGHVHVKDFAGEIRHGDPRTRYLLPGEGALDLDGFLDRLRADGYDGTVTLEPSAVDPDGGLDRTRLAAIATALRALDSRHGS